MEKKLKILIISSRPPYWSANHGYNLALSLRNHAHMVDYLTTYQFDRMESWMYSVYEEKNEYKLDLTFRWTLKKVLSSIITQPFTTLNLFLKRVLKIGRYDLINAPNIPSEDITKAIPDKNYDLVITLFWQGLLSADILLPIYEKCKCPIFIFPVDMNPMTGGCSNFWDCQRFTYECKGCPATILNNNNRDTAHKNYLLKKRIYQSIDYRIFGNTWMCNHFKKSGLFHYNQIGLKMCATDEQVFFPADKAQARTELGLPQDKFIFFCGAASIKSKRKGFDVLKKATSLFYQKYKGSKNCLLVIAGKTIPNISSLIKMDTLCVGFLPMEKLALMYSASDVYLSTSIQDAGPSMVNQCLMCGTPVVAFKTGVAIDIVKTGITGYLAKYNDTNDFFQGMSYLYEYADKKSLRKSCRQFALNLFSLDAVAKSIENSFNEHINKDKKAI